MFTYLVQLQRADGQIVEKEYKVHWDPTKVPAEDVARACAAEMTVASGRLDNEHYKMPHAGLTAVLQS